MSISSARTIRLVVAASSAALMLAACSSSGGVRTTPPVGPSTSSTAPANAGTAGFATSSTAKGTILTDAGRTVYTYDPDSSTASKCEGGCASTWPPIVGTATAGAGLSASSFGTITRSDGSKQVTYDGHPVYVYAADTRVGDIKGDGVDGVWHVVKVGASGAPSSTTPASSPASTPASSSSSSGGGYTNGY